MLAELAEAAADAGDRDQAAELAGSITDPGWQARALMDLAGKADPDQARSLLALALTAGTWQSLLQALVGADPDAVIELAGEYLSPVSRTLRSLWYRRFVWLGASEIHRRGLDRCSAACCEIVRRVLVSLMAIKVVTKHRPFGTLDDRLLHREIDVGRKVLESGSAMPLPVIDAADDGNALLLVMIP